MPAAVTATPRTLSIELLSATTFGGGALVDPTVDTEVDHDTDGLPWIAGSVLKRSLRDAWDSVAPAFPTWSPPPPSCSASPAIPPAGFSVSGRRRSPAPDPRGCRDGDRDPACRGWPRRPEAWVAAARGRAHDPVEPLALLRAFTSPRDQTARERDGRPATGTLRRQSTVDAGWHFRADLTFQQAPTAAQQVVLARAVLALRRLGLVRSRGRGHLRVTLDSDLEATRGAGPDRRGRCRRSRYR